MWMSSINDAPSKEDLKLTDRLSLMNVQCEDMV